MDDPRHPPLTPRDAAGNPYCQGCLTVFDEAGWGERYAAGKCPGCRPDPRWDALARRAAANAAELKWLMVDAAKGRADPDDWSW